MKEKLQFRANEFLVIIYRFALLMFCYTLLRLAFYLFNVDLFPNVTFSSFFTLLYGGFRFDISALTYLNLLFFVLYILAFRLKYRVGYSQFLNILFFTVNGIGFAMNCIDIIYYRFTLKRTTFNVLDMFKNEENMGGLWLQFIFNYWYITLLFIVLMYLFIKATLLIRPKPTPITNKWLYGGASILVFAVIAGLSVAAVRGGFRHSTRPITLSNAAAYTNSPEESAVVLNTPFSFIRTIGKKSFPRAEYFSTEEIEDIFTPIHTPNVADSLQMKNTNVVIFIMESFSREFLGSFNPTLENGEYKGYTPFLDSLAQHSRIYTNAYANGRKSIDAMPSILAGIPALIMPYVVSEYSSNKINSVASLLGEEGYQTAFFHGAPNGSMGFDSFAKISRFEAYHGKNEYGNDDDYDGIWGIWDHAFFQYYADKMNEMQQPFCTAIFSLSSHHPFKVPAQFEGRFPKGKLPVEECIGYSDNALRMFFNKAKTMPWYSNTLFVITADHSSIPDHDEYKNNAQSFAVPIILYAPNDTTLKGIDNQLAQQVDILPTVLSYLNYNKPFAAFGNNLLDENASRFVVNYNNDVYQIMMNDTIAYFDGKNIVGAYDLQNDPQLERNIYQKGSTKALEDRVKAFVQQFNNRMIEDNLTDK